MNAEQEASKKPTMLITGGAGFIGSNLAEHFISNYEIVIVDDLSSGKKENIPSGATFLKAEIGNVLAMMDVFNKYKPEVVIHCAAKIDARESMRDPFLYEKVNVVGTMVVANLAMGMGSFFINFSSGGCLYPEYQNREDLPDEESKIGKLDNVYGLTKWSAEEHLRFLKQECPNFKYAVVRPSNVYGPRQDGSKESGIIAIAIKKLLGSQPLTIFGDGNQTRDFIYVGDVVKALDFIVANQKTGIVNIGTGNPTSVLEVVKLLEGEIGKKLTLAFKPKNAGDKEKSAVAPEKLKSWGVLLDTPLSRGLHLTFDYYGNSKNPS